MTRTICLWVVLIGAGGCGSSHSSGGSGPPVERAVRKPASIEAMLTDTLIRNLDAGKILRETKEWVSVREMLRLLKSDIAFKQMGVALEIDFDTASEKELAGALRTKCHLFRLAGEFRLETALRQILDQAGLGYVIRDKRIVILARPPEKFKPLVEMKKENAALEASLKQLKFQSTVHVDDRFDEILREIATYYAIPIVVRPEVYNFLETDEQRTVALRIRKGSTVAKIFSRILGRVDLTYVIRDGAVIVVPDIGHRRLDFEDESGT